MSGSLRSAIIFGCRRPVAFFAGPYDVRTTIVDALWADGSGEKSLSDHPWQQTVKPFERLVEIRPWLRRWLSARSR